MSIAATTPGDERGDTDHGKHTSKIFHTPPHDHHICVMIIRDTGDSGGAKGDAFPECGQNAMEDFLRSFCVSQRTEQHLILNVDSAPQLRCCHQPQFGTHLLLDSTSCLQTAINHLLLSDSRVICMNLGVPTRFLTVCIS